MSEQRRKRLLLTLLVGLPIGSYVLFSSRGVFSRMSLEVERYQHQQTLTAMRLQQDSLRQFVKRLQTDTVLMEKIARERYGMVKPGEQVFLLDQRSLDERKQDGSTK
jgi:cell division protein FtsB